MAGVLVCCEVEHMTCFWSETTTSVMLGSAIKTTSAVATQCGQGHLRGVVSLWREGVWLLCRKSTCMHGHVVCVCIVT